MDTIHSVGHLTLGTWAVPKGSPYVTRASGSVLTCTIKGFFNYLYPGLMLYSACLATFHCIKVRFGLHDRVISKRIEPFMHVLAWIVPIVAYTASASLEAINPSATQPGFCWAFDNPSGCGRYEDVECNRSGPDVFRPVMSAFFGLVGLGSFSVTSVTFVLIYRKVRSIEQRISRYGMRSSSAANSEKSRAIGRQAIRYIAAFALCNVGFLLNMFAFGSATSLYYFLVASWQALLLPLQGFFNAWIFVSCHPALFNDGGPLVQLRLLGRCFTWCPSKFFKCSTSREEECAQPSVAAVEPTSSLQEVALASI